MDRNSVDRAGNKILSILSGIPDGSDDLQAQWAQHYLIKEKKVPEFMGITIRITKKMGRYYVSEWRVGRQSFTGKPVESHIARIASVKGKKNQWQLAWMRKDMRWHDLGWLYRGTFEQCIKTIIEDPEHCFWG